MENNSLQDCNLSFFHFLALCTYYVCTNIYTYGILLLGFIQHFTSMFSLLRYFLSLCKLQFYQECKCHMLLRITDMTADTEGFYILSQGGVCHMLKMTERKGDRRHEQPCEMHCTNCVSVPCDLNQKCEMHE